MTREKILGIVRKQILRVGPVSPEILAEAIVNAVEIALDVESDSPLIDSPRAAPPQFTTAAPAANPASMIINPEQGPANGDGPLIITPGNGGGPVRSLLSRVKEEEEQHWRIEELLAALHANTPERLQIVIDHSERGKVPIILERNIMAGHGFGAAKLIYKDSRAGHDLEAIETFWCNQKDLNISAAIESILAQAQKLYRQRPATLTSTVPIRPGPMTFRLDDPHEEADVVQGH